MTSDWHEWGHGHAANSVRSVENGDDDETGDGDGGGESFRKYRLCEESGGR